MKKCVLLLLVGFSLQLSGQVINDGKIEGSGIMITEERPLKNFTGIQADGCYDLIITQDTFQKVEIKTDDNIMPYVETEVSGGKLRIFFSDRYHSYEPTSVTVYISSSLIEDIGLSGSGTIRSTNQLKSKKPHYTVSGSGNMHLSVVAEAIETTITGSGTMDLRGSALFTNYSISGSGNMDALALVSSHVRVEVSGSGDCLVNAETSLDVRISGSGNVRHKGSPRITTYISGSGKVGHY